MTSISDLFGYAIAALLAVGLLAVAFNLTLGLVWFKAVPMAKNAIAAARRHQWGSFTWLALAAAASCIPTAFAICWMILPEGTISGDAVFAILVTIFAVFAFLVLAFVFLALAFFALAMAFVAVIAVPSRESLKSAAQSLGAGAAATIPGFLLYAATKGAVATMSGGITLANATSTALTITGYTLGFCFVLGGLIGIYRITFGLVLSRSR